MSHTLIILYSGLSLEFTTEINNKFYPWIQRQKNMHGKKVQKRRNIKFGEMNRYFTVVL